MFKIIDVTRSSFEFFVVNQMLWRSAILMNRPREDLDSSRILILVRADFPKRLLPNYRGSKVSNVFMQEDPKS